MPGNSLISIYFLLSGLLPGWQLSLRIRPSAISAFFILNKHNYFISILTHKINHGTSLNPSQISFRETRPLRLTWHRSMTTLSWIFCHKWARKIWMREILRVGILPCMKIPVRSSCTWKPTYTCYRQRERGCRMKNHSKLYSQPCAHLSDTEMYGLPITCQACWRSLRIVLSGIKENQTCFMESVLVWYFLELHV